MSTGTNPGVRIAPPGAVAERDEGAGRGRRAIVAGLFALLVAAVAGAGLAVRRHEAAAVALETRYLAVPTVAVVHPRLASAAAELSLPAMVQAETTAPIFARTGGYLKRWYFDIGAHVEAGQLLAQIEAPEVDEQLRQALAQLATARASYQLAATTAARYQRLVEQHGVSQQDADTARGSSATQRAMVDAAASNVRRLRELQRFEEIRAPFSGVVTARNTDVGALIDAGSSGGSARQLFQMADTRTMRVYVNVPESSSQAVKPGMTADLTMTEFPGRTFQAVLRRTAQAIDPSSRTLLAELSVPNPTGELLPGSFATIHFRIDPGRPTYLLPVAALLFRAEGLRVVTVDDGNRAVLRPIELGRDLGNEVEVLSGLTDHDRVIISPPDSIASGAQVRVSGRSG